MMLTRHALRLRHDAAAVSFIDVDATRYGASYAVADAIDYMTPAAADMLFAPIRLITPSRVDDYVAMLRDAALIRCRLRRFTGCRAVTLLRHIRYFHITPLLPPFCQRYALRCC